MKSKFYFKICSLITAMLISGCTTEIKEVGESKGLDTIPFYSKSSPAFDTNAAIRQSEEDKKAKFSGEVEKRIREQEQRLKIPDPWIPPDTIDPSSLPPALRGFPKDKFGYPDWTAAVRENIIRPRSSIEEGEPDANGGAAYNEDILFEINDRLMANVLFSHRIHSFWLSCKNCHPSIFIDKKRANKFTMYDVWNGKYCGRCHGKVAFQPKGFENCQRCHNTVKKTLGIK